MLYKLYRSVYKEMLLLKRDPGGLIILFLMPLVLIIAVTLIQDSTFKKMSDARIPILFINADTGNVSRQICDNLGQSELFTVVTRIGERPVTESQAKEAVNKGRYRLAIIIPENLSYDLQQNIDHNVKKILGNFGVVDTSSKDTAKSVTQKEIRLYFDPAVQMSFRNSVMSSIDKMVSQVETQSIYATFQGQMGGKGGGVAPKSFITFKEMAPKQGDKEIIPNSVQHNVCAWALFAIFFIVIPLSINIVKEKTQGTSVRLLTNPVSPFVVLAGKTITYSVICMAQFYMMVAVAVFFFPHIGLPALSVGSGLGLMSVVALFSGLAAIGYGILIGTVARTQEQSAPFGATSVLILAAIGGVWVPVFAMPHVMQMVARSSPMNWGLEGFYDVMLRNATIVDILPRLSLLLLFFVITLSLALLYDKKKRAV